MHWLIRGNSPTPATSWYFKLRNGSQGVCFGGLSGEWQSVGLDGFADDQWHLIATGRDGDTQFISLDGEVITRSVGAGTAVSSGGNQYLRFGKSTDSGYYYQGYLQDVRVYDAALTVSELQKMYSSIVPAEDEADVAVDQDIQFTISDDKSGIDLSSIEVIVEGVSYSGGALSTNPTGNGYEVSVSPATYNYNDTVAVTINAQDNVGNSTQMSFSFETAIDNAVPQISGSVAGAVHQWLMNETSGSTAYDNVATADGTIFSGVTLDQAGRHGQKCFYFDGTDNGYFLIDNNYEDWEFGTDDYTITVWIKTSHTEDMHFMIRGNVAQPGTSWYFKLRDINQGVCFGGLSGEWNSLGLNGFSDDQWHLVTTGRRGSTQFISLDDTIITRGVGGAAVSQGGNRYVRIGKSLDSSFQFTGYLQDIRIYDRGISDEEINTLLDSTGSSELSPADGETDVPVTKDISFVLTDMVSGIDQSTIEVIVEGITYSGGQLAVASITDGYAVTYNPSADLDYSATINVTINAEDNAGNALSYAFSFTTVTDLDSPNILGYVGTPINHYPLDETSGAIAYDKGSSPVNASNNGAVIGEEGYKGNKCYYFSGDDYLLGPAIDLGNEGTFSFWVKVSEITGSHVIFSEGFACNSCANHYGLRIENSGGKLTYGFRADNDYNFWFGEFSDPVSTNEWLHIIMSFDAEADIAKFYINSELVHSGAHGNTMSSSYNSSRKLHIGTYNDALTNYFKGYIQDFRVYDRALTEKEAEVIYKGMIIPYSGQTDVPVTQDIVFSLVDETSGIDESTIGVVLNGTPYDYTQMTRSSITGGFDVTFNPSADLDYSATINVTINAQDDVGNAMSYAFSFNTVEDNDDPYIQGGDNTDPLHCYKLNETSGGTVYDSGSNPVHGTNNGASQGISGYGGQSCYEFNKSQSDYINLGICLKF